MVTEHAGPLQVEEMFLPEEGLRAEKNYRFQVKGQQEADRNLIPWKMG